MQIENNKKKNPFKATTFNSTEFPESNKTYLEIMYETDFTYLTDKLITDGFNIFMKEVRQIYLKNSTESLRFDLNYAYLNEFSDLIFKHEELSELIIKLNDKFSNDKESFFKNKSLLEENGKASNRIFYERNYVDSFQFFELYLSGVLEICYWIFPKFLLAETKNNKITVQFDDIFKSSNILSSKKQIIEQKVKDIIQANNVSDTIRKFNSIFGVDLQIPEEDLTLILLFSLKRNVIIHNRGVINNIYINDLESKGFKNDLIVGSYVLDKFEEEITIMNKLLNRTVDLIYNNLILYSESILKKHKNKYK